MDNLDFFSDIVKEIDADSTVTLLSDCSRIDQCLKPPLPDIIFLDYNMPLINGIECLKKIRAKKECDHIPVVFYSVFHDKAKQAYQLGANYFIVKQISAEKTRSSLESVFKRDWKDKDVFKSFGIIFRDGVPE